MGLGLPGATQGHFLRLAQLSCAEGRVGLQAWGRKAHPLSTEGVPALQWSPHLMHLACSFAKREHRALWAGETTEPGSGVQDVPLALSPTADKEPVQQGPSEEGVPAEM